MWVGDDESGPAEVRMMWILSADDVDDDGFRLDLNAELTSQEPAYQTIYDDYFSSAFLMKKLRTLIGGFVL